MPFAGFQIESRKTGPEYDDVGARGCRVRNIIRDGRRDGRDSIVVLSKSSVTIDSARIELVTELIDTRVSDKFIARRWVEGN